MIPFNLGEQIVGVSGEGCSGEVGKEQDGNGQSQGGRQEQEEEQSVP